MFLNLRPSAPLNAFVESLWYSERGALPHTRERSLPTGSAHIVIPLLQDHLIRYESVNDRCARRLHGPIVQGPSDRFGLRGTGGPSVVIGVQFKPGGAAAFFGGALPHLRNRTELLEDLWGPAAPALQEQLKAASSPQRALLHLQGHLVRRLQQAAPPDPLAVRAIAAFGQDPALARVQPVQRAAGHLPAQFIRRFEAAVGLTPKRYARVLRLGVLLPTLVRCGPRDWAGIAVDAGYFDQSHLIREFRQMAGMSPGQYTPVHADMPTHVALHESSNPVCDPAGDG
ncbi:AraC-like DNA-binding protein [Hydrogenophaga palleronii]|uniref:AraC-like DNA-binding protein n=1 Tax=Hydrogenophaga palleronii TaxID=65655 RepID=A0ABU1WRP6_9BURK|nr:helix-turn-helix domain-containing protein [Hydrogenophaga palleronii]MDR7151577.1 AraC-like DNA-binding protein [Hydrogenophaga palleronii]